ncbi:uncharacterized protein [Linepithema humile]|uniref:uncharacterized protein isoform X2 n=1 Tax=Linepithema humile TaxID=83485 RepID=UPI00351E2B2E
MSGAPARGTVPRRQRRHHHHHHQHHHHQQKHQKRVRDETPRDGTSDEPEEKRPKVNPIFLWASQREQRIVEVRCEDYDKRNRIKLTKTAQGWRSIPRTTCNVYTIATACKRAAPSLVNSSPASSVSSNDEKENGKRRQEITPASATANPLRRKYATNGLLTGDGAGHKKRRYDEEENRRGYSYPLRTHKDSNWNSDGQDCSDEIVAGENGEDNGEEQDRQEEQSATEDRLSLKIKDKLSGRINLERLQKDKLFQPRVVLEQLHLSQLPESASKNVVRRARSKNEAKQTEKDERDEENVAVDEAEDEEEEQEKEESGEKPGCRVNKAGIQDILNMIDATASPVLATDTPSADLPIDSTKTYEILGEKQPVERKVTEPNDATDRLRSESASVYRTETIDQDEIDDKLEVYEEKILEGDKLMLLSLKSNSETTLKSCKVAEADGGFVGQSRCRSTSLVAFETPLETEEEAPDEPGELLKIDYKIDSSKILNALRNTPGLSISVASHAPEIGKNPIAPPRPPSKASSSSRSPDSQAECAEKLLLKNSHDYADNRSGRCSNSPRNLPGLSIVIPNYRYKSIAVANQLTTTTTTMTTISPGVKRRVESPESTVTFNKVDTYPGELNSLRVFPPEEGEENEEDDDCDSQVLEDLRRQKADSLAYDSADVDYYSRSGSRNNHEDRKTSPENAKGDSLWNGSSRSSEAQAKCKHADLENLDLVLEELRSRGTVVSPQPSGIPCSPASRRPSSTYLERLLPSPPCSVTCSEDAKSELTLKSILASSNCTESRDCERSKEGAAIRSDQNVEAVSRPVHSSVDRNARRMYQRSFQERVNIHSQEARNSGRPLSSGDIHSTFYTMAERAAPKRPMSAEWQSAARPRNQIHCYQKLVSRTRNHFVNQQHDQYQVAFATSSSTDGKSLDPASQLRELIETVGHLIPDPLLVPRNYLPGLAAAPATEIPKLLASRPELRLPEALTRPDLLRDPDLLVISLAHLQHVLDHGEGPVSRSHGQSQHQPRHPVNKRSTDHANGKSGKGDTIAGRPKLSVKPIGTLMATQPIDLSNGVRSRVSPCPPLLRVRSGLLKQEPEVSSTASSPDESQLWHPLFGSQKRQQQQQQQQQQPPPPPPPPQPQQQHASWHRTTLAS